MKERSLEAAGAWVALAGRLRRSAHVLVEAGVTLLAVAFGLLLLRDAFGPAALDAAACLVKTSPLLVLGTAGALVFVDGLRGDRRAALLSGLTALLGEAGQQASSGAGLETALFEASTKRKNPAARRVRAILATAEDRSLEEALDATAEGDPEPVVREMASLLGQTVRAGGSVGERLRTAGGDLARLLQAERLFLESLGFEVFVLRGLVLAVVPALFTLLSMSAGFKELPGAVGFFALAALLLAALDGVVHGSVARGLRRAPLYIALAHFVMLSVYGAPVTPGPASNPIAL